MLDRTKKNKPRVARKPATSLTEYSQSGGGQPRQPLSYEGLSAERKKQLDANRIAAQRSRQRRQQRAADFEKRYDMLTAHVHDLGVYNHHLRDELVSLFHLYERTLFCLPSSVTKRELTKCDA